MPGETGVTVVTTLVCFFNLHARLRVHRAPGIPCALYIERAERKQHLAQKTRGEIAKSCPSVIARSDLSAEAQRAKAEATKQSNSPLAARWIASLRSQ